jgi:hypothetical protein
LSDSSGNIRPFFDALYRQLLETALQYFIPDATVHPAGTTASTDPVITFGASASETLEFDWLGHRYRVKSRRLQEFRDDNVRIIRSIGRVLSIRYQLAFHPVLAAESTHLFSGTPQDRYVSAFLDSSGYRDPEVAVTTRDRIADALEVLRLSSLTTYENRRISTGVVLFGSLQDPCHVLPPRPEGALRYSSDLTFTRSFHRLSDGLKTVALVNREGLLVELIDVEEWARPFHGYELPAPVPARYEFHSLATICGGHICMILTANGDIKVFANGSQVFTFRDGRWHLASTADCYRLWSQAVGNEPLARRLFTVALNLAEDRRGALFVVLHDASLAHHVVAAEDLIAVLPPGTIHEDFVRRRFHYLLRDQDALTLSSSVLETVARIDGAIVLEKGGSLLSFGAILQNSVHTLVTSGEGSRTAAAVAASNFGTVLKVSEDGMISCFQGGQCLWEI